MSFQPLPSQSPSIANSGALRDALIHHEITPELRHLGPVTFQVGSPHDAVASVLAALAARQAKIFAFCNMHTFNLASRQPVLADALSHATVFNDGVGMDLASLLVYGRPFPHNLNGTDLTPLVLASLKRRTSVFLIGAQPGVAELAAATIERQFPMASIVGTHDGYFDNGCSDELVERVRQAGAELLLLAMGNPRQELWAAQVVERTGAVILCIGAYLDFISGRMPRAPRMLRNMRLEWLYRLVLEPRRLWRRYIGGLLPFLWLVRHERARQKVAES